MKKIAITGSFASGKSFILDLIKSLGYAVFSCDDYVRYLYEKEEIKNQVTREIRSLEVFDKKKLAGIIYNFPEERIKLEKIIHPMVREGIFAFQDQNSDENLLFFEVPLLFEKNFNTYFDYTICVYCDEEVRLQRAKKKKNFSNDIYEKLKQIQLSQEEKLRRADYGIKCHGNQAEIMNKIKQIIDDLL